MHLLVEAVPEMGLKLGYLVGVSWLYCSQLKLQRHFCSVHLLSMHERGPRNSVRKRHSGKCSQKPL